jgi:hypothetical protein
VEELRSGKALDLLPFVLFEEKGSFDPPLMLGENLERV